MQYVYVNQFILAPTVKAKSSIKKFLALKFLILKQLAASQSKILNLVKSTILVNFS